MCLFDEFRESARFVPKLLARKGDVGAGRCRHLSCSPSRTLLTILRLLQVLVLVVLILFILLESIWGPSLTKTRGSALKPGEVFTTSLDELISTRMASGVVISTMATGFFSKNPNYLCLLRQINNRGIIQRYGRLGEWWAIYKPWYLNPHALWIHATLAAARCRPARLDRLKCVLDRVPNESRYVCPRTWPEVEMLWVKARIWVLKWV